MPLTDGPLAVLTRVATGERIELVSDAVAGRVDGCEIPLTQTYGSRTHAKISFDQGLARLEDLGSDNGTFVNDVRISVPVPLKSGDRLRFYAEEFVISLPEPTPAPVAAPAPAPVTPQTSGEQKRPGAWAHTLSMQGGPLGKSTKYIPASEIKQMMESVQVDAISRPEDIDVPYLQVTSGKRVSENLPLRGAAEWSVGSDPQRDVILPDDGVSAFHARIVNEGKRWRVVDEMSANGTFVNGKRSSVSYLSPGDQVRFGPVACVFQTADSHATPAPEATWEGPAFASKPQRRPWAVVAVGVLALLFAAYLLLR